MVSYLQKGRLLNAKKKVCTINRMNFLRNFPTMYALCKMAELPKFTDGKLIDQNFFELVNNSKLEDDDVFEETKDEF